MSVQLEVHSPFRALGMDTAEQVLAAAAVRGPEMRAWLGSDPIEVLGAGALGAQLPSAAELEVLAALPCRLGVNLDAVPSPHLAYAAPVFVTPAAAAPNSLSHIADLPPIRDQQNRGTCVAFAVLSAYEHYLRVATTSRRDLSEQFLYWSTKQVDGYAGSGTWIGRAMPQLQADGVCDEADWAYVPNDIPGNEGQDPPPPGAQLKALSNRPGKVLMLPPNSTSDYLAQLLKRRCVAFSVPVFNSWLYSTSVRRDGNIHLPIPGESRAGGHAMCIVGYQLLPEDDAMGGGRFLLRNSWGTGWAGFCPFGAGYGTIPFSYITRYASEAWVIE